MAKQPPQDVEAYIGAFPATVQQRLEQMRRTIRQAARGAEETISYGLPAYAIGGKKLVWFAAFASHIGFYPGAAAIKAFERDLKRFKTAKGSVQFPLDEPLPLDLVTRMVTFRVNATKS
jgi:uncharacterized protein YdhG (YjbR/CyaY superfamily)